MRRTMPKVELELLQPGLCYEVIRHEWPFMCEADDEAFIDHAIQSHADWDILDMKND